MKIACKAGASKGDNIYTKILIRKFIWLVYVFKNNVLVFICKLANQTTLLTDYTAIYRYANLERILLCSLALTKSLYRFPKVSSPL